MIKQTSLLPENNAYVPLAERLRPTRLEECFGQSHLLNESGPIYKALASGHLHSMLFWGPPGCGKTTLARLIAQSCNAHYETLSAVLAGVKDIRALVEQAKLKSGQGIQTVLFVDEVHRFNKAQQDAFLPHVENGTFIFLGATTENPSFELNNALLSRVRTYVLKALTTTELEAVLKRALNDTRGYADLEIDFDPKAQQILVEVADGDARRLLNLLEIAVDFAAREGDQYRISVATLEPVLGENMRRFDKGGDAFYDQISALHKSVRGSDPDAALYWFCRMLDGGCDPNYLARRITRIASEDVGNADPRALQLCLDAWEVFRHLGSPEGELALAQAVLYLASVPKSNAVYLAYNRACQHVKETGSLEVPLRLRNAPTKFMQEQGYGKDYRYAHNEANAFAAGEQYFPDELPEVRYYEPTDRGLEQRIGEHLRLLREQNGKAN